MGRLVAVVPMSRIEPDPQNRITGPGLATLHRNFFGVDAALAASESQALERIVGQPRADPPDVGLTDQAASGAGERDVDFGVGDKVTSRDVVISPVRLRAGKQDETRVGTPRPTGSITDSDLGMFPYCSRSCGCSLSRRTGRDVNM